MKLNFEHVTLTVTFDNNESKSNPSCSMPPALIKATYNDYFSILHFTDSLSSLSKKFNIAFYFIGRHVLLLYPLLLCYHTHLI